jgi:hypothetical protein
MRPSGRAPQQSPLLDFALAPAFLAADDCVRAPLERLAAESARPLDKRMIVAVALTTQSVVLIAIPFSPSTRRRTGAVAAPRRPTESRAPAPQLWPPGARTRARGSWAPQYFR